MLDLEIDLDRAADVGTWRLLPENSQVLAVHAALLHTDRVCFFAGSSNNPANVGGEYRGIVWNFGDHSFTRPQVPADVFCSGHALLADGRLLVAGGTLEYDFGHPFFGLSEAVTFDADAEQWTAAPSMAGGRWYPTLITLADGRSWPSRAWAKTVSSTWCRKSSPPRPAGRLSQPDLLVGGAGHQHAPGAALCPLVSVTGWAALLFGRTIRRQ